jgi:hypothetical protein
MMEVSRRRYSNSQTPLITKEARMAQQVDFSEIRIGTEIPFNDDIELPDGTVGHFHIENPVVDNDGKVIGFVVSFHDEADEEDEAHDHEGHHHHHA